MDGLKNSFAMHTRYDGKLAGILAGALMLGILGAPGAEPGTDTNAPAPAVPAETTAVPDGTNQVSTNASATVEILDRSAPKKSDKTAKPAVVSTIPRAGGFIVKSGFKLELVAESPIVASPVAMTFDERGRLFVVEMRDHPNGRDATPHLGRVRLLEDPDGTGLFKSSTVFADGLAMPSALACFKGGIFVAATPDILYFKDTDGNGMAEERRVVFTGFGGTNAVSPDRLISSLTWGPDGRIHGLAAGVGGVITFEGATPEQSVQLGQHDFSFDPLSSRLTPETGSGSSSLAFDDAGRKFIGDCNRPLQQVLLDWRYAVRNPFLLQTEDTAPVISPATAIYRYSAAALATRATGANSRGQSNSPPMAPVWMSQARGMTIYRGYLFPTNYYGNAFIPDTAAGVIHRIVPQETDGLRIAGSRAADERNTEFLISSDPDFHPTQVICGFDGALYISDLRQGGESGRIYRLAPEGFQVPKPPQLDKAKTPVLVSMLGHTNSWHRETVARLLIEQQDPAALPLLSNMLAAAKSPLARLGALNVLGAGGAIREPQLIAALRDGNDRVRTKAMRLAETCIGANGQISDPLWSALIRLNVDPSPKVRYQLALTAGMVDRPNRPRLLAEMARRDLNNEWFRHAILTSALANGGELLATLLSDSRVRQDPGGAEMLRQLAVQIGTRGRMDEVGPVLQFIQGAKLEPLSLFDILSALGEGLLRTGSSLALVDPDRRLLAINAEALALAADAGVPEPVRLRSIRLLGLGSFTYDEISNALLLLLGSGQSQAVQVEALRALAQSRDPRLANSVLARWGSLTSPVQTEAIGILLCRNDYLPAVLGALENRRIAPGSFSSPQRDFLRTHPDPAVRAMVGRFLGDASGARPAVMEQFRPALRLNGNASRGRQTFLARCASCHRVNGEGNDLGPNLAIAKMSGQEHLLASILEPNARLQPLYETHVAVMRNGESVIGILKNKTDSTAVLDRPGWGRSVLPGGNVIELRSAAWSLMPEGLEQGMNPQGMSDLLAYLIASAQW
jgi:putative membrane-bound dehydrogenase-like protein